MRFSAFQVRQVIFILFVAQAVDCIEEIEFEEDGAAVANASTVSVELSGSPSLNGLETAELQEQIHLRK